MTHTTKHTPGPWFANQSEMEAHSCKVEIRTTNGAYLICSDAGYQNAPLIAAAPAMYEALQHAATSYHHPSCKAQGEYAAQPERYCTCHVQKARTALAQAERRE